MGVRAAELAIQLGPWVLLSAFVATLAAIIWLVRMVLHKRADMPDKDLRVEIGPLRIAYTTPVSDGPGAVTSDELGEPERVSAEVLE
jgi:hypothetical protein